MQRYFVKAVNWNADTNKVIITGDDVHHIQRVMRNEIDDEIICIHPDKTVARCKITQIDKEFVESQIVSLEESQTEMPIKVSVVQSLPKGDKLDLIMQKGTELGANSFYLYEAERSIVKWNKQKIQKRMIRLNKIIKEAAEQSYRKVIPTLYEPGNLKELIEVTQDHQVKLIAYEDEAKKDKSSYQFQREIEKLQPGDKLVIFIGPEGGFTKNEINQLTASGFKPVKLGNRILRTETASFYALSAISYHFE